MVSGCRGNMACVLPRWTYCDWHQLVSPTVAVISRTSRALRGFAGDAPSHVLADKNHAVGISALRISFAPRGHWQLAPGPLSYSKCPYGAVHTALPPSSVIVICG